MEDCISFQLPSGSNTNLSALDRAADAALAAHAAIKAMGADARPALVPLVELLLVELGKQLAGNKGR